MTTVKKEWSNTNWGKLVMVGLTAIVVSGANNIFTSASNVTRLPSLIKNVDYLMMKDAQRDRKANYDSIRAVSVQQYLIGERQRKRDDDSLRQLDAIEYFDGLQHKYRRYLPKKGAQRAR